MTERQIEELSREVFNMVFGMLDLEPEFTGVDAGSIADAAERAFRDKLTELHVENKE